MFSLCLHGFLMGYLDFFPQSYNTDFKMTIGVNVNMNARLSLCHRLATSPFQLHEKKVLNTG